MSNALSWWIGLVAVLNILACVWLIWWSSKRSPGEAAQGHVMGHTWDGDLQEYNNPLPRWWLYLFYITIAFALIYLVFYPGFGKFKGLLGWSQEGQYDAEVKAAKGKYDPIFQNYGKQDIPVLAKDPQAMKVGQRLFVTYCAVCHGSDARGGAKGFPNLTDNDWLYSGTPEAIETSILKGRESIGMPAQNLSEADLNAVVAYVMSLSGRQADAKHRAQGKEEEEKREHNGRAEEEHEHNNGHADAQLIAQGKDVFNKVGCIGCHGADAKGNQQLGAPNLTDTVWLYGGTPAAIKETIVKGRKGKMPAHEDFLGKDKVHLLAAYVYGLSAGK